MPASSCRSTMRASPPPTTAWCRPARSQDYRRWLAKFVESLNRALEGIPEDRVRYHVCWGSWPGPHVSDVPLRDVVDMILKVQGRRLRDRVRPTRGMSTSGRCGRTSSCRTARVLIPGVISHATNVVEHPELIAERIVRFANLTRPRERHDRHRLRLRAGHVLSPSAPQRSCGRSSRPWSRAHGWRPSSCGVENVSSPCPGRGAARSSCVAVRR